MTKFTIEQCQPDFSRALSMRDADSTALEQKEWTQLFPVVKKMVSHFKCLPQSLMIFNAYNWYAAEAVLNEHLKDVPSLFLQDYDKQCLFGRLTIDSAGKGNVSEGLISKLDNGVLVLHISPLLSIPQLWFSLKRFLLTQQVNVQSAVNATRFKGELQQIQEKKLSTKIILVANRFQLDELTQIDPEFTQIQSIFCELPNDIISNDHNIVALKTFCQNLISEKQLPPLSDDAFNCLFADLSKYCEHQKRILFAPELIENTLRYAQLFSNNEKELPQKALQQAFNIQDDAQSQ
ncbi:MAG TPA: ATP-dependent protease, partial [Psychromonas hadalis]|nr:ATP-dependent protease [Psychromonas hadalis]